jgi:ATP/maltotriose-dependent transcriptional regulator MalT/DNA-binding SARP family transcriptional activator
MITRTKIIIPRRRAEILSRQRLLNLLLELLDGKLTIIAAPAGYGKTSLLIDFANQVEMPVCWFSLDPLDRDPQRFLAHFIAALNLRFPRFGKSSRAMFEDTTQEQLDLDRMTSTIINDIYENITEHFTIFLDDYHLVGESKPVESFVNRFVQDVDENCHMVIASRVLLTLPDMTLLVARSQVGGLSFDELAFKPEEIQKLLKQNYQMAISEEAAKDLEQQTEGWITGLLLTTQMAGRHAQDRLRLARVSGVGLYEYMTQQILAQQPGEVQDFLLRTSFLEEFDAGLCRSVIGQALNLPEVDWEGLMETALHNNLFILPVGEEGLFLRYHHLFRDYLQNRMLRERADESREIQTSLARVYAERGEWERAYEIFKQLSQPGNIANLIEQAATPLIAQGRLLTLAEWLEALPQNLVSARPALVSIQGSLAVMRGDTHLGLELLDQAIEALRDSGPVVFYARSLVRRSAAHRFLGEYQLAIEDADQALDLPVEDQDMAHLRAEAMRAKGICLYNQGDLQEALVWSSKALLAYRASKDERNVALVSMETGMIFKASGDYEAAKAAYLKALDFWEMTGNSVGQANLLNNLGVLQHLQGDYDSAISSLERAVQHAQNSHTPRIEAFALTSIGDLYRDLQAGYEALEAYHKAGQIAQQVKERFLLICLNLAEARLTLDQQPSHAEELINLATSQAETGGSQFEINLCRLVRGQANVKAGAFAAATCDLEKAAAYFKGETHRLEAALACMYLAISEHNAQANPERGENNRAMEHLAEMFSLMPEPKSWQPLAAAGIAIKTYLAKLQDRSKTGRLLTELLQAIDRFEQRQPELMRQLRHKATAVPAAPPRLTINALGRIQVRLNGHPISSAGWRQITARDILYLLLAYPKGLTKEQIGVIFWPESSKNELKLRFKNAVYRLRHAVGKEVICFEDEIYRFNYALDYSYDVESFQNEIDLANMSEDSEEKITHYKAALKIYKGPYLLGIDEDWIMSERWRLEKSFFDALLKLAGLYLEKKQFEQGLMCCEHALDNDPCLEDAYRMTMQIYVAMGNWAAAIQQYEKCQQTLLLELSAMPSDETQALYKTLIHS